MGWMGWDGMGYLRWLGTLEHLAVLKIEIENKKVANKKIEIRNKEIEEM